MFLTFKVNAADVSDLSNKYRWGQVSKYALTDKDCAVSETEFTVRMHNIYWTVNGNANGKGI